MSGFFLTLKNILYNIGLIKMKSVKFIEELVFIDNRYGKLFNLNNFNNFDGENKDDLKKDILFNIDKDKNHSLLIIKNKINNKEEKFFDLSRNDYSLKDINYNGYYDLYLDNLKDFSNRIFIELKRDLNLNKCEQ
jgi:hypothetical protein